MTISDPMTQGKPIYYVQVRIAGLKRDHLLKTGSTIIACGYVPRAPVEIVDMDESTLCVNCRNDARNERRFGPRAGKP